jgi:hypothetical protein
LVYPTFQRRSPPGFVQYRVPGFSVTYVRFLRNFLGSCLES